MFWVVVLKHSFLHIFIGEKRLEKPIFTAMGIRIKKYLFHLLVFSVALCSSVNTVAARQVASSKSEGVYLSRFDGLPNSEIELVNHPVSAAAQTVLQKNVTAVSLSSTSVELYRNPTGTVRCGTRIAGLFKKTYLSFIFPFHHFW